MKAESVHVAGVETRRAQGILAAQRVGGETLLN
jgi:hypothetical protein